jgi:hypothetical protein
MNNYDLSPANFSSWNCQDSPAAGALGSGGKDEGGPRGGAMAGRAASVWMLRFSCFWFFLPENCQDPRVGEKYG